ncbi:MAG: fibronectin type III domain-containing protein, partial [Euryarchaeota archaeon]|nr:fibronectin type III domain-containing protein [Euryarchaeota archaeon]
AFVANTSSSSYADSGLTDGTTYSYAITAVNAVGEGPSSAVVSTTTFDVPSAPQNLSAEAGPGANEISLSWQPPADDGGTEVTDYAVHRDGVLIVNTSSLSYLDTGLANGTAYAYEVVASNLVGPGPASAPVSATTFDVASEPENLSAQTGPGAGEITVSWDPPLDDGGTPVENYTVERRANDTDPWAEVDLIQGTVFTDSGLGTNATWCYRVAAINLVGEGPYGLSACATTFDLPAPPSVSTMSGSGSINVSWGASPDDGGAPVDETRLYGGNDTVNLTLLAIAGPSGGSFDDSGHPDGHWRHYAASAVTVAGEGPLSELVSERTFGAPDAPANVSARSGPQPGEVTLGFEMPSDDGGVPVTGFDIYRGLEPDELTLIASPALGDLSSAPAGSMTAYTYTDGGLYDGTTYHYAVAAVNDEGEGTLSPLVFGSTYTSSEPPEPLPSGRTLTSAVFDGRHGYVFGGLAGNVSDGSSIDEIVRFDPFNETNQVVDHLPSPRHATSSVWVPGNQSAYIFFGHQNNSTEAGASSCHPMCHVGTQILKYTPPVDVAGASASSTGSFEFILVDENVSARHSTAGVYVPPEFNETGQMNGTGLAYVFGGLHDDSGPSGSSCHPMCHVGSQIGILDPLLDKFDIHGVTLPQGFYGSSGVYVPSVPGEEWSGKIYLFGGHGSDDGASGNSCHPMCMIGTQILSYDPVEGKIDVMGDALPSERWYTSSSYDGVYAYIFGGENHTGPIDEILRFDPATGEVIVIGQLPSERGGTSSIFTGEEVYVFGGDDGEQTLDAVVRFDPAAPQGLEASAGPDPGKIRLEWDPPVNEFLADVVGYRVYGGTSPEGLSLLAVLPDTQTTFVHSGLANGVTRYYRVSAVSDTDEGPQSNEASAKTFTIASAPRNLQASTGTLNGNVHLSWDAPADNGGTSVTQYWVFKREQPLESFFTHIAFVQAPATTFTDTACTLGEICDYRVWAVNAVGTGPYSNTVSVVGTKIV